MHVVRVKQVNLYDIRAKQASRYNALKRWPRSLQTAWHAVCRLQTARGFQIAWNTYTCQNGHKKIATSWPTCDCTCRSTCIHMLAALGRLLLKVLWLVAAPPPPTTVKRHPENTVGTCEVVSGPPPRRPRAHDCLRLHELPLRSHKYCVK